MRQPIRGEMLRCYSCGEDCEPISEKWIENFKKQDEAGKKVLYSKEKDCFLSYDGCEEDGKEQSPPGLDEEYRQYIRGTSYRPL